MSKTERFELDLSVQAGPLERENTALDVRLDLDNLLWHAGVEGHFDPYSLALTDGQSGRPLPVQWEDGVLSMILYGTIPAEGTLGARLSFSVLPWGTPAIPPAKNDLTDRVVVTDLGREILFSKNQRELCRYKYRDPWKPYFCPINGPHGNVVRDRILDAEGHHFHHGLWVAYGSMDHNSVNLWCEDTQVNPRRGPTGRIVHDAFERFTFGWVYGLVRERLNYCKPDGQVFARELRTLRVCAPTEDTQIIDWTIRLEEPEDSGKRGMMFALRVAPSMQLVDLSKGSSKRKKLDNPGKIMTSGDQPSDASSGLAPIGSGSAPVTVVTGECWTDFSGSVNDGWDGIALFDHPVNPGYPWKILAADYGHMTISREYPQDDLHRRGAVLLRHRAYVHAGDAEVGQVAQKWHDYVHPPLVVTSSVRRP